MRVHAGWLLALLLAQLAAALANASEPQGKVRVTAPAGVVVAIQAVINAPSVATPDRSQALDVAITPGLYSVSFFCPFVMDGEELISFTSSERGTRQVVEFKPGHNYQLSCVTYRAGVLRVEESGAPPNNSSKPTPLRGAA